jgi:predicted alpha-1,2-mannosidase
MRPSPVILPFLCLFALSLHAQTSTPLSYANPLVGTAPLDNPKFIGNAPPAGEQLYSGFTPPGPLLPHAPFEAGPVNANIALNFPAGINWPYYYPNQTMYGFTAGGPGGPLLIPVVGDWLAPPAQLAYPYAKSSEHASPGFYSVTLDTPTAPIQADLTATLYTSLFRFTFPASSHAHLLISLYNVPGHIERVDDHTFRGVVNPGAQLDENDSASNTYFVAEVSVPIQSLGTFRQILPKNPEKDGILGDVDVQPAASSVSGFFAGVYLDLQTTEHQQVMVKIAHGNSYEQATSRLHAEQPGWDFATTRKQAETAWTHLLDRVEVEGGTEKERTLFYSTLLHSFTSPRLLARTGETFTGLDGKPHTATHDRYGPIPFWDTGRNQIVLLTLLEPEQMPDILQSQLDMALESGYMGTSFHGDNAVFLYLGAWERGIPFDYAGVYDVLRKNAMDPAGPRHYLAEYIQRGWISDNIPAGNPSPPYASGKAGAATTLEYAWDDYALSLYARKLGKTADADMFLQRAANYRNVFDPSVGFIRGRTADGAWAAPAAGPQKGVFDPQEPYYNFMMKEASGWSTLWLVPQDVAGLTRLLGGRPQALAKLDAFFSTPYTPTGICRDCTGMVGQYVQGNQPDQHAAYLYDWLGQPWKTQQLIRRILAEMYGSDHTGYAYPGMDDQGSTSSWYVLSAMGFYPVDPSSSAYILGSPLFNRVKLHLANGKIFEIVATQNSSANIYIQSATLNGKPWNKPWFSHADIAMGGSLVLTMGPTPNRQWGASAAAAPPSMSPMP